MEDNKDGLIPYEGNNEDIILVEGLKPVHVEYDNKGNVIEIMYPFSASDDIKDSMGQFANRIVGFGYVSPKHVLENPFNFRIHTAKQRDVLTGVLEEVGWGQNIIVNIQTKHIVDGHLRAKIADEQGQERIPTVFVDLNKEEEKIMLLMFDQTGSLAGIDFPKLAEVGADVDIQNQMVNDFLEELMEKAKIDEPLNTPEEDDTDPMTVVSFTVTCTYRDLKDFQSTLSKWNQRGSVTIDFAM